MPKKEATARECWVVYEPDKWQRSDLVLSVHRSVTAAQRIAEYWRKTGRYPVAVRNVGRNYQPGERIPWSLTVCQ